MHTQLSPNFDERPEGVGIDMLVLHYTGMRTPEEALRRLQDEQAKVSAHYFVKEDGEIIQLVPESKRAWHAGVSCWRGRESLNDTSIGIEVVNPGHEFGYRHFPAIQMISVIELCQEILDRHSIPARNVLGHSDIAPERKEDPGELFDWAMLAREGIGLYPTMPMKLPKITELEIGMMEPEVEKLQQRLHNYGYKMKVDGYYGNITAKVVTAFQRHFTPNQVNGAWGALQEAALEGLLAKV